jgi:hypothetical protein
MASFQSDIIFLLHVLLYSRMFLSDYPILVQTYGNATFKLFYNSAQDFAIFNLICCHVWIITALAIYIYTDSCYVCKILLFLV